MPAKWISRTSWRQKLEQPKPALPKVVPVPVKWRKQYGPGTMLVPHPLQFEALIRTIPAGKLATVEAIRERLARDYGTDYTCPLVTGIFLRIVAEASDEDRRARRTDVTPYWRVLASDGSLRDRFPGGVAAQARRLRAEGHTISPAKGKRPPKVKDFEQKLISFARAAAAGA